MSVKELRACVDKYVRDYTAIQRLISLDAFSIWYNALDEHQQSLVLFCVAGHRYTTLRRMFQKDLPLECFTYRRLRHEASKRGIPGYSRMSKDQLIFSISDFLEAH